MSIYTKAQDSVRIARKRISDLLEIAGVADNSVTDRKVVAAFENLEEVLDEVPRVGRTAALANEESPVIYVVQGRDIRDWPTDTGRTAMQELTRGDARMAKIASTRSRLAAPPSSRKRRAITASVYERMLEESALNTERVPPMQVYLSDIPVDVFKIS